MLNICNLSTSCSYLQPQPLLTARARTASLRERQLRGIPAHLWVPEGRAQRGWRQALLSGGSHRPRGTGTGHHLEPKRLLLDTRQHCCAVRMTKSRHRDPEAAGFHRHLGTWPDIGLSTTLDFPPWAGFGPMDTEAPSHLHHSVIL